MVDAIFRRPNTRKVLAIERAKNKIAVTSKMEVREWLLLITPYFILVSNVARSDMQKSTVETKIGSISNEVLQFVQKISDPINVAFLYPKYLTTSTYRTCRPFRCIILYA